MIILLLLSFVPFSLLLLLQLGFSFFLIEGFGSGELALDISLSSVDFIDVLMIGDLFLPWGV